MRVIEVGIFYGIGLFFHGIGLFVPKIFPYMGLVFVLPNQFFAAKLIEVLVVFPKLEVYVFALITGHLIKDTQIGCTVVRAELLHNLS